MLRLMIILLVLVVAISFASINIHLLGRLFHTIFPQSDLFVPVIVDNNFRWDLKGSNSYTIPCRYYDLYEIGVRTDQKTLPSGLLFGDQAFRFQGQLQVRVLRETTVLYETTTSEPLASWLFKGDDNFISHLSLATFPMPLNCNKLTLEINVLLPDEHLQSLASPQLYVRVSPIP